METTLLSLRHSASKLRLGSLPRDSAEVRVVSPHEHRVRSLCPLPAEHHTSIDATAFVADGARIVGDVSLAAGCSVWYNAVLRGDSAGIVIGPGSNVQDNVSVHVDSGHPVVIGSKVSVGHNAVVHGCTIGDGTLVGMGSSSSAAR